MTIIYILLWPLISLFQGKDGSYAEYDPFQGDRL